MKRGNILSVTAFSVALLSVGLPHAIAGQGGVSMGEWGLRRSATASPRPEYPKQSLPKKVEAVVVAAVLFGVDGKLATIDILQSQDEHTATAVRDAVGRWTVPAVQVGGREEKSPVQGKLTFYFQVRAGNGVVLDPDEMPGGPTRPNPRPAPSAAPSGPPRSDAPPAAPTASSGHGATKTITVEEFKKQSPDAVVVDVGDRSAFRRGHWPGAVNIPADEMSMRGGIELPRDKRIVIDCTQEDIMLCRQGGGRLVEQKFTDIVLLVR